MPDREAPITGFTTSIREYTRVEGIILRPAEAIVKYGTLVLIDDKTQEARYLGMIVNVEEETPHPALDVDRLRRLYQTVSEASFEDANRVLMELLSPTHKLIKWSSIMRVDIKVLGVIRETGGGPRLDAYERPPRPFSSIQEPDPGELERVIHHSLGPGYSERGLYLGRLSLYDKVRVYLNPERLTTHLSILAQTGAGKTETVKRLVYEVSQRRSRTGRPRGGIVVFDIAGEYTGYPYINPDTVPLIDAVLRPEQYHGAIENPDRPGQVTVIVPYEASRAQHSEQQELLWQGVVDLACQLSQRLDREVDVLAILPYERRTARAAPGRCPGKHQGASYSWAYTRIEGSPFLVIALPLPGFMDVDTMIELSGTQSEYFPLIVNEIAGSLDLYHGGDIYGVTLLRSIVRNWEHLARLDVQRIMQFVEDACNNNWNPEKTRRMQPLTTDRSLFYGMMRLLAWKAYRWGIADPRSDTETRAACKILQSPDHRRRLEHELGDLLGYLKGSKPDRGILASATRALWKLSNMTSDMVDTVMFDALMERLARGFSIVHLAPPSTGNVDPLLSQLIRRLFLRHAGRYDPGRLTVLVVEEAHNLAPAGEKRASKESLLRVAREGRKWGLSLWIVTQRPSFVDSSILSQTATSILLRTTNPEDLASIRRSVESAAAEIVDRLPELEPTRGEALLTGLAAPERRIPLLVMVDRLRQRA